MYTKKDEFKNTKHILYDKFGVMFIMEENSMDNDMIYNRYKFMYDVVEDETIETKEEDVKQVEDVKEPEIDPKADILDELEECITLEQIHELANENNIDLDLRIKNIKKAKKNFEEEVEAK